MVCGLPDTCLFCVGTAAPNQTPKEDDLLAPGRGGVAKSDWVAGERRAPRKTHLPTSRARLHALPAPGPGAGGSQPTCACPPRPESLSAAAEEERADQRVSGPEQAQGAGSPGVPGLPQPGGAGRPERPPAARAEPGPAQWRGRRPGGPGPAAGRAAPAEVGPPAPVPAAPLFSWGRVGASPCPRAGGPVGPRSPQMVAGVGSGQVLSLGSLRVGTEGAVGKNVQPGRRCAAEERDGEWGRQASPGASRARRCVGRAAPPAVPWAWTPRSV